MFLLQGDIPWDGLKWVGGTIASILIAIGGIWAGLFASGKIRELRTARGFTAQDQLNELHKTNDGEKRKAEVELVTQLLNTVKEVNLKYDGIHDHLMELSKTHAKLEAAAEYKDIRIAHLEKENDGLRTRIRLLEEHVARLMAFRDEPIEVKLIENGEDKGKEK